MAAPMAVIRPPRLAIDLPILPTSELSFPRAAKNLRGSALISTNA